MNRFMSFMIAGAAIALSVGSLGAQVKEPATLPKPTPVDRSKIPAATAAPVFKVPAFTVDTLSNGARLVVVERHGLPIVNLSIHFEGGTNALGAKAATGQLSLRR